MAVAVAVPRLELDRPFTYLIPEPESVSVGTLVSVPFHGRTVKGWVLGPTSEIPDRVLPVRRVLSRRPIFDERTLELCRWVSERYVVPLATAIGRLHPPRVAGEEARKTRSPAAAPDVLPTSVLASYERGGALRAACSNGSGAFVFRSLPDDEQAACLEAVAACVEGDRDAIVLVPESQPTPSTAAAVLDAFGEAALWFAGGDARTRYRSWIEMLDGVYRVVVGTRPAVFAPARRLGLVWVHRDAHPGHREERTPAYHVREVALARGRLDEAVVVLAGQSPSAVAALLADEGGAELVRAPRARERAAAPMVETVRSEREDRTPRLRDSVRSATSAFLLVSRRGYGIARVCRACGEPARCGECMGAVVIRQGRAACAVCEKQAVCGQCGADRFRVERGGTERIEEWVRGLTALAITRVDEGAQAIPIEPGLLVVGTAAAVKDVGPRRVDLVGILDPDRALRRAGLSAQEQSLATWIEAAAWAGPKAGGGRVLVQTGEPGHAAIQALVRWDPWRLHRSDRQRRAEAGFPVGFPVFRVRGRSGIRDALAELDPVGLLASDAGDETVCLLTLRPDAVPAFRRRVVALLEKGIARRVEAEPQL
ncbi:MAG: hypothetical protein ACRDH6_01335 [Actinomycetota bacterium]